MISKCYTIGELLCWLDVMITDCSDRICLMNNILTDFYDYMYWSPLIKLGEGFVWSGDKKIELTFEPYKIEWFYGWWKNCANNNCFIKVQSCLDCVCPELYQIKMENSLHWVWPAQYMLSYDDVDDKWFLDFNIPAGVDRWYVVYSRTHKPITMYDETICIDHRLLTGLKLMIRKYIAINQKETNLAQFYWQELAVWKANKEKEHVWNLISVMSNNVWQLK